MTDVIIQKEPHLSNYSLIIKKISVGCLYPYTYLWYQIDNINLKNFSIICRKFANYNNSNRRLIKEKLKTILNEISMSDGCKDIFKYFVDAEEKRNNIAHCNKENKYQENDYENFIINYLKLLYMLRYNKGVETIFKS